MNKIDIARGIVFQKLNISKSTFEERLVCQKKIYLLQSLNVPLGFYFDWYVYGPYSKNLTAYVYDNYDLLIQSDFSKYRLSDTAKTKIQTVNQLEIKNSTQLSIPLWYELLASLLYIYKNPFLYKNTEPVTEKLCCQVLSTLKPKFKQEDYKEAIRCLSDNGFCSFNNGRTN